MNKTVFGSSRGPAADARNEAGGLAYKMTPKHALAQLAATGCISQTYYATAKAQLDSVTEVAKQCESKYLGQTALFARKRGYMKDMPALICGLLCARKDYDVLRKVFPRVIDNGKMLRNFCQVIRSGALGRKSFGTAGKELVRDWLGKRDDDALFRASVGQDPSLADIIKMVHPKPKTKKRAALYGYLIGKKHDKRSLPLLVKQFEGYKAGRRKGVPDVPFQMLTALDLGTEQWAEIAKNGGWHMTRMNLNTFARHGVYGSDGLTDVIADKLRNKETIKKAKVFPYQLFAAYQHVGENVPQVVTEALQDALDAALSNIPEIPGNVYVCPDVSGSMSSPVTGVRGGGTTKMRCIDIAALVAAAICRVNPGATVLPFEDRVVTLRLNPRDSVMTNAEKLSWIGGGGTDCSAPLKIINGQVDKADAVIFVSDYESWVDTAGRYYGSTGMMEQWTLLRKRCPKAKLICIDIQPTRTVQANDRKDILNIGGFSDHVFEIMSLFVKDELNAGHWVGEIEKQEI